jgi:hypothetical protein
MCIDQAKQVIYLLGGWDGQKSLDDFWQYDIREERWRVLSHSTSSEKNGPEPRSCHKMVFDSKTGCIYLLGRLGDKDGLRQDGEVDADSNAQQDGETSGDGNTATPFCSEFHRYHTRGLDTGKWDLLCFDTAVSLFIFILFSRLTALLNPVIWGTAAGLRPPDGHGQRCPDSLCLRWPCSRRGLGFGQILGTVQL